jgi:hypothetical protein
MSHAHCCIAVDDSMTCRFDGACYGEICVSPAYCRLKEEELTAEDRETIAQLREAMDIGPAEPATKETR